MKYDRYLEPIINEVCFNANKMAFVSGPRQCGKTTMAKLLLKERGVGIYNNWDEVKFRRQWTKDPSFILPIEVKLSDEKPSPSWGKFMKQLNCQYGIQLVMQSDVYKIHETPDYKILVISAANFLKYLI